MNRTRRKTVRFALAALMTSMLAGCVGSERFYEQAGLSRETEYRQWMSRKERQEQAQPVISGKLSVEDCLKLAMVNNKALQRVTEEREIARGERLKSYSAILPGVALTGERRRLDEVQSIKMPPELGGRSITMGDVDNY
ncbi:MAG: hypothetical protein MUO33_01230 [Sedimentisphaerales bacterium]|nr:hypothetical protein [Sedimentisphaerales bacterium]